MGCQKVTFWKICSVWTKRKLEKGKRWEEWWDAILNREIRIDFMGKVIFEQSYDVKELAKHVARESIHGKRNC